MGVMVFAIAGISVLGYHRFTSNRCHTEGTINLFTFVSPSGPKIWGKSGRMLRAALRHLRVLTHSM